jgi:hypothetical protein
MKDKIKIFLRKFKAFDDYAKKIGITDNQTIIQLFTVFSKDERFREIQQLKEKLETRATARQLAYIRRLAFTTNFDLNALGKPLEELTKAEASMLIDQLTRYENNGH